jgi:hypothetical protein
MEEPDRRCPADVDRGRSLCQRLPSTRLVISAARTTADSDPILPPNIGEPFSLRATTPGFTNRYVATVRGLGVTAVVTAAGRTAQKQAATFVARPIAVRHDSELGQRHDLVHRGAVGALTDWARHAAVSRFS